jgi:hypothetical protein
MDRTAQISPCGYYRYALTRSWDASKPQVLIVGLNPSIADAEIDDPTLKRCITFAKAWGCGGLLLGNLFAYRATNPRVLRQVSDPVGPENDVWLGRLRAQADLVVAAWGNHGNLYERAKGVAAALGPLDCLGVTKSGAPRHPLYVPASAHPIHWTA